MKLFKILAVPARPWVSVGMLALAMTGTAQAQYDASGQPIQTDEYTIQEQGSSPRGAGPGIPEEELGQDRRENALDNEAARRARDGDKKRDERHGPAGTDGVHSQPKGGY